MKSCVLGQNKASELLNESILNKTTNELVTSQAVIAEEEVEEDKPIIAGGGVETSKTCNNTSRFHT